METFLAVTVALAAAAFGGFFGSWVTTRMRIEHEREESLRARMIEAADNFTARSIEALNALQRLVTVVEPEDLEIDEDYLDSKTYADEVFKEPVATTEPLVDAARVHLARVHLLFGASSSAGRSALALMSNMTHVLTVIGDEPGIPAVNLARSTLDDARRDYEAFSSAARAAIRKPDLSDVRTEEPSPVTRRSTAG